MIYQRRPTRTRPRPARLTHLSRPSARTIKRSNPQVPWVTFGLIGNIICLIGIFVSIFALPWLSFNGSLDGAVDLLRRFLPPETLQDSSVTFVLNVLENIKDPSGWELFTTLPTFNGFKQLLIYCPLLLLGWIFLSTLFGWNSKPLGLIFGLVQIMLAVIVIVVLIIFTNTLQIGGLNIPGLNEMLRLILPLVGVQIGPGYWLCLLSAFLATASGGLLVLGAASAP